LQSASRLEIKLFFGANCSITIYQRQIMTEKGLHVLFKWMQGASRSGMRWKTMCGWLGDAAAKP
jgi:hypothetical protein